MANRITLSFDTSGEEGESNKRDALRAMRAGDAWLAFWDIDQEFRKICKYGTDPALLNLIKEELLKHNEYAPSEADRITLPSDEILRAAIEDVSQYWRSKVWEIRTGYSVGDDVE